MADPASEESEGVGAATSVTTGALGPSANSRLSGFPRHIHGFCPAGSDPSILRVKPAEELMGCLQLRLKLAMLKVTSRTPSPKTHTSW